MRITEDGQVTIPIDIRNQAGLLPNTEVEFAFDGVAVRLFAIKAAAYQGAGTNAIAHLRGRGDIPLSADAIMALTRADE